MASIKSYKDKTGKKFWSFQAYLGTDVMTGKRQATTRRGFATKAEAKQAATELEYKRGRGEFIRQPSNAKFGEVADAYWKEKLTTIRESTVINRRAAIEQYVLPALAKKRIGSITHLYLRQLVTKWSKKSRYETSEAMIFMRGVFDYAIDAGMISKNPVTGIPNPKPYVPYNHDKVLFWDRDQMAKFFSCIDQEKNYKYYALFKLMALTGIRHGELVALQWKDLNLEEHTLHIYKTMSASREVKGGKVEPPKTPAGTRVIPLDDEVVEIMTKWHELQNIDLAAKGYGDAIGDPDQWVFTGHNNRHYAMSTIPCQLKKIIEDNDLKPSISIHKFRHSFISNMLMAGVPINAVQRLAGHETPKVTLAVYAHMNTTAKKDAMRLYANYMHGAIQPE